MLVQVNAYYDEECRKLESHIRELEEKSACMKAELKEEGDAA